MNYCKTCVTNCTLKGRDLVVVCSDYVQAAQPTGETTTCRWTQDADGTWFSLCGEAHVFTDGTPKENKYKFCQYCGRILEQVAEIMGSVESGPIQPPEGWDQ